MAHRSLLPQAVDDYLRTVVARESPLLQRLRAETAKLPLGGMQIGADQGVFLAFLARLIGARNAIEIGTFTGYSAISVASALAPGGRLVCCDVNEEWTAIARRYWAEAGLSDRIELHLRPARETVADLKRKHGPGSFDFAFIDADKTGYDAYYEGCLRVVRRGGLIVIDNTLQHGRVVDPAADSPNVSAIRALNAKIHADQRVDAVLLPLADGVTLVRIR
jgi:caffeoyl-CoA O-methyltransferase